jgi:hypothetical protein
MNPKTFSSALDLVRAEASEAFARLADRGFRLPQQTGLYPRVHAERDEPWFLGIDFWMSLDEQGRYRTEWTRDTPFELSGVAAITREENGELVRYRRRYVLYAARPYDVAVRTLGADVIEVADVVEGWSREAVILTGERASIPQRSSTQ